MHDLWWLRYLDYILVAGVVVVAFAVGAVLSVIVRCAKRNKKGERNAMD